MVRYYMHYLDLVKKRQSTRDYSEKAVSRKIIDRAIEVARLAPSACNSQPWYFIVVDDPALKDSLTKTAFSGMYSMCSFAKKAPVIIAVITESSNYGATLGGYLKGTQFSLIDIGIACEHLILQATEDGVGSCWIGWFDAKKVKKVLGLEKNVKIDTLISLGYPADENVRKKKRKELKDIRKYNV